MSKKVLLASYIFPPLLSSESILAGRCVKYLPRCGWQPAVVTVKVSSALGESVDASMMDLLPPGLEITRAPSFEPKLGEFAAAKVCPILLKLPDTRIAWSLAATSKALDMLRKQGFDVLYSRSMYLSSHLVGLRLKRKTGLPWVAQFSDPWVDNPYRDFGRLEKRLNARMESEVMRSADAIVFVSEETRQLVTMKYPPQVRQKSVVIPHGYDPELAAAIPPQASHPRFTLTYTGNFYGSRTPLGLFQALRSIVAGHPELQDSINVQIVGNLHKDYRDAILKLGIERIVTAVGAVTYMESLKYMRNSDVLVLIDAPSAGPSVFLPLKLVEYVGFKKPILGITPLEGTSASLIRRLGGVVVSPEDTAGIEQALLTLHGKYRAGDLSDRAYPDSAVEAYSAANTTKMLADVFNRICGVER